VGVGARLQRRIPARDRHVRERIHNHELGADAPGVDEEGFDFSEVADPGRGRKWHWGRGVGKAPESAAGKNGQATV
jgi:hypothetical protein